MEENKENRQEQTKVEEKKKKKQKKQLSPFLILKMKKYLFHETDEKEEGFEIVKTSLGRLSEFQEPEYQRLEKAIDLEEGDRIVVKFRFEGKDIFGSGEITSIDNNNRKPFSVFMDRTCTEPFKSFKICKEDILYKFKKEVLK